MARRIGAQRRGVASLQVLHPPEFHGTMRSRAIFASPTGRVFLALVVGLILGIGVAASHDPRALATATAIEPIGVLWVNAIRMTVIPLVVALLISSVADRSTVAVGRLGRQSLLTFLGLLVIGCIYSALTVTWSMHWPRHRSRDECFTPRQRREDGRRDDGRDSISSRPS